MTTFRILIVQASSNGLMHLGRAKYAPLQLLPRLRVYSDQKLGANDVEDHLGGCSHANSIFLSRLWDLGKFRSVRCRSSGQWNGALSAPATSAFPHAAIDRAAT